MAKIKDVTFTGGGWDPVKVHAEFDDGSSEILFDYFDDELSFSRSEFIGLTRDEALERFYRANHAYLCG